MGLFKPAWMTDKSKKADKAIAAVGRMDDPSELAEVVLNAPLKNVAEAALERIHDETSHTLPTYDLPPPAAPPPKISWGRFCDLQCLHCGLY